MLDGNPLTENENDMNRMKCRMKWIAAASVAAWSLVSSGSPRAAMAEDEPEPRTPAAGAHLLNTRASNRDSYSASPFRFEEVDECTEGARVTATKTGNGKVYEAVSDSYGDFWVRDVEPGEYTVLIEKDGYLPRKMGSVDANKDINIGDIEIWQA